MKDLLVPIFNPILFLQSYHCFYLVWFLCQVGKFELLSPCYSPPCPRLVILHLVCPIVMFFQRFLVFGFFAPSLLLLWTFVFWHFWKNSALQCCLYILPTMSCTFWGLSCTTMLQYSINSVMYFNNWETSVCTVYIHYDGPKKPMPDTYTIQ